MKKKTASALLMLLLSGATAHAASLGRLQVLSAAGQPLLAEIEVEGLSREDFETLAVGLADPAAFKAAQLDPSPILSRLRFSVVRGLTEDRATVRITTAEPVPVRSVDTLIELSWASGRIQREYTLAASRTETESKPVELPSAPAQAAGNAVAVAPSPPLASDPALAANQKAAAGVAQAAGRMAEQAGRTVRRGDSLGQIAREVAPTPAAVNSAMAAIFEANRKAFIGDSIHMLREGAVLNIPQDDELTRRTNQAALKVLSQFDDRSEAALARVAAAAARVSARSDAQDASGGQIGRVEEQKPAAKLDDQLKVSRSRKDDNSAQAAANAQAEELLIREKALREANDRIAQLEKNLADLQRLMELKAAADKSQAAVAGVAPAVLEKPVEKAGEKAAEVATDAAKDATKDGAKAAEGDPKAQVPDAVELKPDAEGEKKDKPEAELAHEDEDDEHGEKKHKPWYKNGLILGGIGGVVVLGGGAAGFLFMRRRRQLAAEDVPAGAVADALADPTADLLNADVTDDDLAQLQAGDADLPGAESSPGDGDFAAVGTGELADGLDSSQAGGLLAETADDEASASAAPAEMSELSELSDLGGSAETAEAAAAVDLDFETAAGDAAPDEPGSLLPPDMQGGDPPKPGASSSFADELDALSGQVGQAQSAMAQLREDAAAAGGLDDDFGALSDEAAAAGLAAELADEKPNAPPSRLSDTLANIDLDLPGAQDPLPADPFATDESAVAAFDEPEQASSAAAGPADAGDTARWQEMETKLDLAAAYIEIGDSESARDLLGEVLKQGDESQMGRAQDLIKRAV